MLSTDTSALRGCGIRHSLTVRVEGNFYYGCRNVNVEDWINGAVRFGGCPRKAVIKGLAEGDSVYSGQTIGSSDNSGRLTGAHLHYTYILGSRTNPAAMSSPRVGATSIQLKDVVRVSDRIQSKKLEKGN